MGIKKNNIIQNFENNLSVKNLNEFMTKEKILFDNFHEFNGDNETFNSLINLFILDTKINNTTYYDNLDTNIHYFNEDYIFATVKINEIDCSFYNTDTIKEYLFMTSFLSDFYKSKYENTNQNNVEREYSVNNNTINIKLKFGIGYSGNIESIWYTSSKTYEFVPIEVTFNNIKNSFERDVTIGNLDEQPNRSYVFNLEEKNKHTTDFNKLFNKIKSEIKDELNKNRYYYNSVFLSYKYAYYNILLNYNTIRLYYLYIKKGSNSENSKLIKYQDIYEILLKFYELFSSYEIKLDELIIIIKSVELVDEISESEKNENAKIAINKLQQINYNLLENHDYIKNNYRKVKITKTDIQTNKIKIIVISLLMILSFITFFITINYYSLNTSKLLSIIILSIIVCVILINNYIIKNKTYENFDSTMLPSDSSITDLMSQEYLDSLDVINSEIPTEGAPSTATTQNTIYTDLQKRLNNNNDLDTDITKYSEAKREFRNLTNAYELAKIDHVAKITEIDRKISAMTSEITAISTKLNDAKTMLETKQKQLVAIDEQKSILDALIRQQTDATDASEKLERDYKTDLENYHVEIRQRLSDIKTYESNTKEQESSTEKLNILKGLIINEIGGIERQIEHKKLEMLEKKQRAEEAKQALRDAQSRLITANADASRANAALLTQRAAFAREDHPLQVAAAKAISDAEKAKGEAETEEENVSAIQEKGANAIRIIQAKIKALKDEFNSRPKDITYEIKLDLKYDFVTNNTDFDNKILLELSLMLLVPLSRFKLKNKSSDDDDNIKLEIIFSPSRLNSSTIYSNSDLITTFKNIFNTPPPESGAAKYHLDFILNTKYLKFITEIKTIGSVSFPGQNASFSNKLTYTTQGNLIQKFEDCNTKMESIKHLIAELDLVDFNPNTYYNEINPRLNLEVKKYSEKNTRIDNDTNILDSKTDILIHDYINSHYIYKHLSYITFLLSFVFLSYSYLNDYILVIYIIATIIFFIIVLHLYIDIYKNVRRKSKKKYWVKPFKV